MWVTLDTDLAVLRAVADLGDAELVVKDYSIVGEEITEDRLSEAYESLILRMVSVLASLELHGEVNIAYDLPPDDELIPAIERALEKFPQPIVITPELSMKARRQAAEKRGQTEAFLEMLQRGMQREGLRRGLNKEEREKMTLGEYLNREDTD